MGTNSNTLLEFIFYIGMQWWVYYYFSFFILVGIIWFVVMPVEGRSGLNSAEAKAATVGGRLFYMLVHRPMRRAH